MGVNHSTNGRKIAAEPQRVTTCGGTMGDEVKTIREAAIELTVKLVEICDALPNRRVFTTQILRSCSSIGANASEAKYAQSDADFINKLEIALKECYETNYWLEVLFKTNSISEKTYESLVAECNRIRRQLVSSIKTVKEKSIPINL